MLKDTQAKAPKKHQEHTEVSHEIEIIIHPNTAEGF